MRCGLLDTCVHMYPQDHADFRTCVQQNSRCQGSVRAGSHPDTAVRVQPEWSALFPLDVSAGHNTDLQRRCGSLSVVDGGGGGGLG